MEKISPTHFELRIKEVSIFLKKYTGDNVHSVDDIVQWFNKHHIIDADSFLQMFKKRKITIKNSELSYFAENLNKALSLLNFIKFFHNKETRIFRPSINLKFMLDKTDFKEIPLYQFKMPIPTMIIRFPQEIEYDGSNISEMYCHFQNSENTPDGLAAYCMVFPLQSKNKIEFLTIYTHLEHPSLEKDDILKCSNFSMLGFMKEYKFKENVDFTIKDGKYRLDINSQNVKNAFELQKLQRFSINFILYLNSVKKEITKVDQKTTPNFLGKLTSTRIETYDAGKTIYIKGGTKNESNTGTGNKKTCPKWLVRGHWRKYSEEQLVWIEPYYKGEFREDISLASRKSEYKIQK